MAFVLVSQRLQHLIFCGNIEILILLVGARVLMLALGSYVSKMHACFSSSKIYRLWKWKG